MAEISVSAIFCVVRYGVPDLRVGQVAHAAVSACTTAEDAPLFLSNLWAFVLLCSFCLICILVLHFGDRGHCPQTPAPANNYGSITV